MKLFKKWKYDLPYMRRTDNFYQIITYYGIDGTVVDVSKEDYFIELAKEIKELKKADKIKTKEYKKAIQYLKKYNIL